MTKIQNKFPIYRIGFGKHPEGGWFFRADFGLVAYRWSER